jgi:lipoyl(octanoyl) transferase
MSVQWLIWEELTPYEKALSFMEQRVQDIRLGLEPETILLLEHPPLYTGGTSASSHDLKDSETFPVYQTGRGGQYTYHGPHQRVIYVMLDLQKRGLGVREFVKALENWLIQTLDHFHIKGEIQEGRVGVWVKRPEKPLMNNAIAEDKIAAIGVRIRRGVSFHGMALNVDPNLSHFQGIVPCGLKDYGVTSFYDLGYTVSMEEVDCVLKCVFHTLFDKRDS